METEVGKQISRSVEDSAKIAGLSRAFLYNAIKNDELKSIKVGRRRLILDEDLLAFLKSKRV
jgi:excisionase family DNA binding protein